MYMYFYIHRLYINSSEEKVIQSTYINMEWQTDWSNMLFVVVKSTVKFIKVLMQHDTYVSATGNSIDLYIRNV